jgi:bis(5'-nucleosidyl)-tetraphosphatase
MGKEKSAGAVIFRKAEDATKYLLLHYGSGHWDFVKGNVEPGEDELATIKREAKEETGMDDLNIVPRFREVISYFYRRGGEMIFKEVVFYLAETKKEDVKISYEHVGFEWLGFDDAYDKITYSNSKNVLKKAHSFLSENVCFG